MKLYQITPLIPKNSSGGYCYLTGVSFWRSDRFLGLTLGLLGYGFIIEFSISP